jgi:hypothetical protein
MIMSEESILLWWLENSGPSPAECRQIEHHNSSNGATQVCREVLDGH